MAIDSSSNVIPQRHRPQQSQQAVLMELCWLSFWICLQHLGMALVRRRAGTAPFSLPSYNYDEHRALGSSGGRHQHRPLAVMPTIPGDVVGMTTLQNPHGRVLILLIHPYDSSPSPLRLTAIHLPPRPFRRRWKTAWRFPHPATSYTYDTTGSHRFSTKPQEGMTGAYYYGYRWMKDGRWLSRDPIGEVGGVNLYSFVGNDGVNGWDRLGLKIDKFTADPATLPVNPVPPSKFRTVGTVAGDVIHSVGRTIQDWNFYPSVKHEGDKVRILVNGKLSLQLIYNMLYRGIGNDDPGAYPLGALSTIGHERYHAAVFVRNFNKMADDLNPWEKKLVCEPCVKTYLKWINGVAMEHEGRALVESGEFDQAEYGGGLVQMHDGEKLLRKSERLMIEAFGEAMENSCPLPFRLVR